VFTSPPALAQFDNRLSQKFFEGPADELVGSSQILNISKIRKEAAKLILSAAAGTKIPSSMLKQPLQPLLNMYAPLLNYEKTNEIDELTDYQRRIYELAQAGLLPAIKTQLTVEFMLWYILEIKIGFRMVNLELDASNLLLLMERVYKELNFYGPDSNFNKVINFDNPDECNWQVVMARGQEIYSHLMTSLLRRLQNLGYFNLNSKTEKVSATAVAVILPECKTVSLIYVNDNNQTKPLIAYVQQAGPKNIDNVITTANFLFELIHTIPTRQRLAVWQNSFTTAHLIKIIETPLQFKKLCALFTEEERVIVRTQFANIRFLNFDSGLMPRFFEATEATEGSEKKLPEYLMQLRRGIAATKLLELLRNVSDKSNSKKTALVNAILNFYAEELGIIQIKDDSERLLNDPAIDDVAMKFGAQVTQLFTVTSVLEYIYNNRIKVSLVNLLANAKAISTSGQTPEQANKTIEDIFNLIKEKLDAYGQDDFFTPYILFDEKALVANTEYILIADHELECQIYITLLHRLVDAGYIKFDEFQKINYKTDSIYFPQNKNGIKLAFVNDERVPFLTYMLAQDYAAMGEILDLHPDLSAVISYYPKDRLKPFFSSNFGKAHSYITNFRSFKRAVRGFTPRATSLFFKNMTSDFIKKIVTSDDEYLELLGLVPMLLLDDFFKKIPQKHFQKLHLEYDKFSKFIGKLPWQMQELFLDSLSQDYLQNIHPDIHIVLATIKLLSTEAIAKLFKKLGDAYLRCIFTNALKLFQTGSEVLQFRYYTVCNSLSDAHLRQIFHDQVSLTCLEFLEALKVKFIIKLINVGCGAYKELFTSLSFLQVTLKSIAGRELELVKQINIDLLALSKNHSHLRNILETFSQSDARLKYCLRLGADLKRFIRNEAEFEAIYSLLNDADKKTFQEHFPIFLAYYKLAENQVVVKITALLQGIDSILSVLDRGKNVYDFKKPVDVIKLGALEAAIIQIQQKAYSFAESPVAERIIKVNLAFEEVMNTVEQAFQNEMPGQGSMRLFSRPPHKVFEMLNNQDRDYLYIRFLGSLLSHIYASFPHESAANQFPLHVTLQKTFRHLKKSPYHDNLLLLVAAETIQSSASSSRIRAVR
jgi:hypothetical protein